MSEKGMINIVWIKRDIRTCDHLPLYEAEQDNIDYICIYVFDNDIMVSDGLIVLSE